MYSLIEKVLGGKYKIVTLLLGCVFIFQLSGCKDSGSVGADVGDPIADLEVDTLDVTGLQTESLVSYTGNLGFFSAGRFNDPQFGQINARAYIRPALAFNNGTSFFNDDTKMELRLVMNRDAVYGDTTAAATFDIVEVTELWRGPAWRLDDQVALAQGETVGSFTVTNQDSIDIPLDQAWVQKYAEFYDNSDENRDSLYVRQFYGLALVPQNSGKILAINSNESNFIAREVESSTGEDLTLDIDVRDAAFSVDRSGAVENSGSINLYSSYEQIINFDFDFSSENLPSTTIAKAELVVYRDNLVLEESVNQAGANVVRPSTDFLKLHLLEGDELPQSLNAAPSDTSEGVLPRRFPVGGAYRDKDGAYHFNLTFLVKNRLLENVSSSFSFYITQNSKDGIIRSNVLFNGEAGTKAPKVIITSTNNN